MVVPLNDLNEQSWPVLNRSGEYLQQVAVVIIVDQNEQFLNLKTLILNFKIGFKIGITILNLRYPSLRLFSLWTF